MLEDVVGRWCVRATGLGGRICLSYNMWTEWTWKQETVSMAVINGDWTDVGGLLFRERDEEVFLSISTVAMLDE